jgi:hypothetical protein
MKRLLAISVLLFASSAFAAQNLTGQWAIHSNIAGNESDQECKLVVTGKQDHGHLQSSSHPAGRDACSIGGSLGHLPQADGQQPSPLSRSPTEVHLIVKWNSFWQEILPVGWSVCPKWVFTPHWPLLERRPATPQAERLRRSGGRRGRLGMSPSTIPCGPGALL